MGQYFYANPGPWAEVGGGKGVGLGARMTGKR
jgi:hypothetical protein